MGGGASARRKSWPGGDPSDNICNVQEISRTVTNNDCRKLCGVYVERSYSKGQEGHETRQGYRRPTNVCVFYVIARFVR